MTICVDYADRSRELLFDYNNRIFMLAYNFSSVQKWINYKTELAKGANTKYNAGTHNTDIQKGGIKHTSDVSSRGMREMY